MNVVVAAHTDGRSRVEGNIFKISAEVWRFVTGIAGNRTMSALKRECRRRVIEPDDFLPIPHGMAHLAFLRRAAGIKGLHSFGEFSVMRILVAGLAILPAEPVDNRRRRKNAGFALVTLVAENCAVRPLQGELALHVPHERKGGGLEALHIMTVFTLVVVRISLELALVHVLVADDAVVIRKHVDGFRTVRQVALVARDLQMFVDEREDGFGMQRHCKHGRFESLDFVARTALSVIGALGKLSLVIVLLVTVHALRVRDLRLEIRAQMTLFAGHRGVLAEERVVGGRMIKNLGRQCGFKSRDGVARTAGLVERPVMRIVVAGRAVLE